MSVTPTAHNGAKQGEIAKTVLMPGDPLRAKYIAETYLENPVLVTSVRNMFGYTGMYKGREISVMGGGMGMPSVGIYTYELFHFYGVEQIIRIGSAGALQDGVKLIAAAAGKKALCLLTISDLIYGEEKLSAEERQLGFGKMMEIALEL